MQERIPLGITILEREAMLANRIREAEPVIQPADSEDAGMGMITARELAGMSPAEIQRVVDNGVSVPPHYLIASSVKRRPSGW